MYSLYLISVFLHLLAAIVWIGGMAFLGLILAPYLRQPGQRHMGPALFRATGTRFRVIGWICIGLLVLSGIFSLAYRGSGWQDPSSEFWKSSFGHTLAIKLLLVATILLLSLVHDFMIGPRASTLSEKNPESSEAARLRRWAAWVGRLNLFLALIVVALAITLVRGWP